MKKENTKIMLWAVVALVVGVVIGMLITNATIGNATRNIIKSNELQEQNLTNTIRFISEGDCTNLGGTTGPCIEPHNLGWEDCCLISIDGHNFEQIIWTVPNDEECTRLGGAVMTGTSNGIHFRICRLKNGFEATITEQ